MKKAKMVLFSLAILAVVGGALAFKANSKYLVEFCYTTQTTTDGSQSNTFACPLVTTSTIDESQPTQFFYATIKNGNCPAKCPPLSLIGE